MSMTVEQRKVFEKFTTKPSWMKEAVLTKRGWTNPKTGELLLGRRTPDWVFAELERNQNVETVDSVMTVDVEVEVVTPIQEVQVTIVETIPSVPEVELNPEEIKQISEDKLEAKRPVRRRNKA